MIGVLALQGGFDRHIRMLESMGQPAGPVKTPGELMPCSGLIIPGGESTTLTILMEKYGLYDAIRTFAQNKPVMGTCAGAIMLSSRVDDTRVKPLGLMDTATSRNAYGRQVESFVTRIDTPFTGDTEPLRAIFIRAPGIRVESPDVDILAELDGHPVILQQGRFLALAFHPELTDDPRIHRYFIDIMIAG